MQERRNQANYYVNAIIKDVQNAFISEKTISFSESNIERVYEFEDGAMIKYEWQSEEKARNSNGGFNHRFTLLKIPSPNAGALEEGIIKIINYKS